MKLVSLTAVAALFLGACASTPPSGGKELADPYEEFNRQMFAFNLGVDKYAVGPVAKVYETVTPSYGRDRVDDFLTNLKSPVVFVNDVLQAEPTRAGDTLTRFGLNTTLGIVGLWDVAQYFGLEGHDEDFGQTLAVWGVESGPFLVLPFAGATTPRDFLGARIDNVIDPLTWTEFAGEPDLDDQIAAGRAVLGGLNARARLSDQLDQLMSQPEPYVALRRIYSSSRQAEIRNGRVDEDAAYDDLPDFDEFDVQTE